MKRIVLIRTVEQYAVNYLADLKKLTESPLNKLTNLRNSLEGYYYDYVNTIIHNYDDIILAKPNEMNKNGGRIMAFFSPFDGHVDLSTDRTIDDVQVNGLTKQVTKKFYQCVVDALKYDEVQEQIFPKYVKKLGIKSCVYCNAQYAISAKRGKTESGKKYRSTFTIDHYWPKSKYPFLATSFYNLYPACSTCNQIKSYKDPIFELYIKPTDPSEERNPFLFSLDKASFVKYSMTGQTEDLNIKFGTRTGIPAQKAIDYENYFHVGKMYGNYKDTVEEIIWKYRVYNMAGRQALVNSFGQLLPHKSDWNRFVLGNYDREEDVHKRPLAKLVQDVAKQMGLI